jgi:hypothetical protein
MFEDVKDQDVSEGGDDRAVVYAIWARDPKSRLSPSRAWQVLHERYPEEPRFLLFYLYDAQLEHGAEWSPSTFLDDVRRILDGAGGRLHPEVRDLLAAAEDDLHPLSETDGAKLERIRSRVGARTGDASAARKRLGRLRADYIRELHETTLGGRRIGARAKASSTVEAWREAIESASSSKKPWSPSEKLSLGDLVEHPKFGLGLVTATEPGRAQILFESGARKLVSG